ncbi:MAG: hypothetical protein L0H25_10660, partial [Micrococcales bacterium]|nr:hypothetical protein [Micrococcales bacterium]
MSQPRLRGAFKALPQMPGWRRDICRRGPFIESALVLIESALVLIESAALRIESAALRIESAALRIESA